MRAHLFFPSSTFLSLSAVETLKLATNEAIKAAATYGADVAVTVAFGRLGIIAPPEHVRKPMAPSRLCDLLAPGGTAKVFFAPELGGNNNNNNGGGSAMEGGDPLDAARAALAEGGDLAFTVAGKDELSYVAKYVDGKQCLVMQRDTAERAGAGGHTLSVSPPTRIALL